MFAVSAAVAAAMGYWQGVITYLAVVLAIVFWKWKKAAGARHLLGEAEREFQAVNERRLSDMRAQIATLESEATDLRQAQGPQEPKQGRVSRR